jgi:hypothetical protein
MVNGEWVGCRKETICLHQLLICLNLIKPYGLKESK